MYFRTFGEYADKYRMMEMEALNKSWKTNLSVTYCLIADGSCKMPDEESLVISHFLVVHKVRLSRKLKADTMHLLNI